ncbi:amidohydrolase [Glutamicibacter endophyticus]|uniref:amidohydrolase n=1 Tax=Glutamicibacter endophyticus TaxID=1522174 RepID=UPI003AEF6640
MSTILYRNGSIYSQADPFATAMVVDGATIAWLGSEEAADAQAERVSEVIDLAGALITPAFVDAHTHLAGLGRQLEGGSLESVRSAEELLQRVAELAAGATGPVMAHGWDDTQWSVDGLPTPAQLSVAAAGRGCYLLRRDVHSALVDADLLEQLGLDDVSPGLVQGAAHDRVRAAVLAAHPVADSAAHTALKHYAAKGYAAVVEMAAPHIEGAEQLKQLLRDTDPQLPAVYAYWGQAVSSAAEAQSVLAQFDSPRVLGLGGDLRVDGSLGSRTAYLRADYADAAGQRGELMLTSARIADHVVACAEAGIRTGFHVIGDSAMDELLEGFELAAQRVGLGRVQAGRHVVEHAEMLDAAQRQRMLALGLTVSAQPLFDAYWGQPEGMYATRLGDRAESMNNLAALLSDGIPLVIGSDAPVCEVDGWKNVRAAMQLNNAAGRISARAAFIAQTRSAYRALGEMNPMAGQLLIGAPATFAIWAASELAVQTPDTRISSWSTDARAGTPMLPVLDEEIPQCLRTVREGVTLYDQLPAATKPIV